MEITRLETMLFPWGSIFVRVWADNDLYGLGECSPMGTRQEIATTLAHMEPMLVGKDPLSIMPTIHNVLFRRYKLGDSGILPSALAGVDIALWDLLGKVTGQPLYVLFGGAYKRTFPLYASIGGGAAMQVEDMVARVAAFAA